MDPKEEKSNRSAPSMNYRSAPLSARTDSPTTLDEETRSVEIILSTEAPALVYDWDRGIINEVLLMSGVQIPASRQLVQLDAHSRYDTADIIGSVRDVRIEDDRMVGRAYFSAAPEAESPWIKVKEGHLTDFSIGYRVDEAVWVKKDETAIIEGKTFTGPVQVVTKWTPRELSAVPIGADANAKARAEAHQNLNSVVQKEELSMNEQIRKMLESKGLPATATDEEALAFLAGLEARQDPEAGNDPDLEQIRADATGVERERIREIDALLTRYECQDMARDLIVGGKSLEEASRAVLDEVHKRSKNPGFSGVILVGDERDKFRATAAHALELRSGMTVAVPAPGAQELRGFTLPEMARECLRMAGVNHHGSIKEMVGRALTSSDFPYLLANLATKSLQQAWEQQQETWRVWCGIGSVSDFKTYYDNALSEHDDLEEVPESGEIKYGSFSEKPPETYKIATYAKKFRLTRVMIINDDLGALVDLPARRAEAAGRKVSDVVYAVIVSNGNMGDGYALFSTDHANDAVSGHRASPGVAQIAEAIRAMGVKKDIAGKSHLNIRPEYFLAPKALEGVAEVFFRSEKFADSNTVATDSSLAATRVNPYSGNYFTRVYEPRLDDDSLTAWYLAGSRGKTVKVVFLNGVQAPLLEMQQPGFTIEGVEYMVSIDVGAYATDHRGLYRNEGA